MRYAFAWLLALALTAPAAAHDTWVQTNANLVRVGDVVHIDLMLGNHGNGHRDFKLASKITLEPCTLAIHTPDGKQYDLKPGLIDVGYAPKEGFWSGRFTTGAAGLHQVVHTLDTLHRTTRAIKSSKCYFLAADKLDDPPRDTTGFEQPLGHPLELVLESHPVTPAGPGVPIRVRLYYQGQPLPGAQVTFIPRGAELKEEFDPQYERLTNDEGRASFTPTEGNYYLVVVHHVAPEQSGPDYERTAYSATLTLLVPQVCSCCDE